MEDVTLDGGALLVAYVLACYMSLVSVEGGLELMKYVSKIAVSTLSRGIR